MTVDDDFLTALPKVELHLHIEGTLEPELRFRLAERNNLANPFESPAALRETYDFDDLPSFLAVYYEGMNVLLTEEDFYDLAREYLERAAAQNVAYVEMFFDPQAHTSRGVPFDVVIRGLRRAQMDAENRLGVRSALIMCFLRDFEAGYAMATLLESLPYREWIVGVGLDSDEKGNPPEKFAKVFARARREGYRLTMHCDVDQENSIEHIRQVLHEIGVERIDHGTNVLEDEELTQEVIVRGIGLTSCPISNTFCGDGTKAAEIRRCLELGIRITINSDDPAYFGGYVQENLAVLAEEAGFTPAELLQLERNAVDISWAPPAVKDDIRARLDALA
ncbi:adenosine deaminase [Georgenia sp. Z1491]|uniref:adenosine deaminase n=1 Tax=Georgenia sp. Z1491 TaxID=3416707 RepID=UPI003CF88F97